MLEDVKKILKINDNSEVLKIKITRQQAKELLKISNKNNRSIKKSYVQTLKRDMESGNWYNDTDYIGFDKNGILVNGQHRLKALSECEKIDSLVLKIDLNCEQHISMDTGKTRTYSDQVKISHKINNEILPVQLKPIISTLLHLSGYDNNLSNTELLSLWKQYKKDLEECEIHGLFDIGPKGGACVKSSIFSAYLGGVDIEKLSHFAQVLKTGITSSDNDIPIIRLRDELRDIKGNSKEIEKLKAAYTQQCIYNVINGSVSNRLPSNPEMVYQKTNNFNLN